jgi:hypothetical protein
VLVVDKEIIMSGSIRLIVGLLITYGAVGTMDYDPNADVLIQSALAAFGLAIMYSGARAVNRGVK